MAADVGRNVAFTWGGSAVAGVRAKNVSRNGAAVDVTSDENEGWRTLLDEAGQNEYSISLSGVTKSDVLALAWAGTRVAEVVITFASGRTITGDFYLQSYNESAPYNDAVTFDAELLSTGEVTETVV